MKRWFLLIVALAFAGAVWAAAPVRGSVHAASGTSTVTRNFNNRVANLTVAPATQDVVVILRPSETQDDSLTVRAGDVMNWDNLMIYGFDVIRATATVVDVYWW